MRNNGKCNRIHALCRVLIATVIIIGCLNPALAEISAADSQEKALKAELEKVEKQFGRNNIATFKSRAAFSSYLKGAKRYKEVIPVYLQQLKILEKYFGNLPPNKIPPQQLLTINFSLAWAYHESGDNDRALQYYSSALALQEKYSFSNGWTTTDILSQIGYIYRLKGRYADSTLAYQRCLRIQEKAGESEDLASTLNQLGLNNELEGKYSDALSYYNHSMGIYERISGHNNVSVAGTLGCIGRIQLRMDKVADAYNSLQSALAVLENMGLAEDPKAATVINNLAMISLQSGDYEKAITLFKRSLTISEKVADQSATATSLANLSEVYREQAQYDQALPLAKRALEILETSGGKSSERSTLMNNLGLIYKAQGKYDEALIYFQKSLNLLEGTLGKTHPDVATPLNNLANFYSELNDIPKALALAERSLAICEKSYGAKHRTTAGVINTVAALYSKMGDEDKALALYQRSLAILEGAVGSDHPMTAAVQANIATRYKDGGKIEDALAMYQKALTAYVHSVGTEHPDLIFVLDEMSDVYYQLHDYKNAIDAIDWAYRIGALSASPTHWKASLYLSGLEAFIGNRDAAIYFGKQGINALQALRSNVAQIGTEEQKSFLTDKSWLYVGLADILIQEGRIPEAQQVMAMLKEEEYFDFIRRDAGGDARSTRATYTQREALWAKRYAEISNQLVAIGIELEKLNRRAKLGLTTEEERHRIKLEADMKVGRQAFDEYMKGLRTEFAKASPKLETGLAEVGKENLDQLRTTLTSLGHGAVMLQYLVTDTHIAIILTTPQVQIVREAVIPTKDLHKKIEAFLRVLRNPALDPRPQAQALYQLLFAPVAEDLKQANAQTLMLSLDGSLRYLPMAALHDGKVYLTERYSLAMYTEVAKDKLSEKPEAHWKVAGLGLTQKVGEFSALPSVKQELTGIVKGKLWDMSAGVLPGDIYLDQEFTQARLHEVLDQDYSVLHISSHFAFIPGTVAQSFLLLGDGKQLTLEELRTGGWKFGSVDLMTLSSCQTAINGDGSGREIEGFGALVQRQGAKGVLATLWKVADQSTAILMQSFYRLHQENGLTKAEALREAQLGLISGKHPHPAASRMMPIISSTVAATADAPAYTLDPSKPYAHPFYWAPFILMGNWL
jgi:CHAT domain-containing protein/tetratricopeptide (TPR) repeat protein